MEKTISPLKAMQIMRNLSSQNIPFSIRYLSLDMTRGVSEGMKSEQNIILTTGYRRNQSKKSEILASYIRPTGEYRMFYIPLLCELNGIKIKP